MRDILEELQERFGNRQRLSSFFEAAAKIPESFEFGEISFLLRDQGDVPRLRQQFEANSTMAAIYKHIGQNFGPELLAIGISNIEIDRMVTYGYRPKSPSGNRLNFTLDHMHSLFLYGNNKPENICFMPGWLNNWKNVLEQLQIEAIKADHKYRRSGRLITLLPKMKGDVRNQVPYIEGGYSEWHFRQK